MSKPVGPYTPVIRAGDLLFCSGQIGLADGTLVDGFDAQVHQAIANLATHLADHDATLSHVVKTNIYVTDMSNYSCMNEIYLEAFGDHRPARAAVAVTALPLGAEFEIEAVAHVG